ncbi:MAG: hypothetical protein QOE11_3648 [Solirubrobacteraceae bacterium]|nr:hypothetical protein [Solirubrobacteraceae bacterium]
MAGLVEHRDEAGIEPVALVLEDGPLVARLQQAGIAVEVIDAGRLRDPRMVLRVARSIDRAIRRDRPQLVFANLGKAHLYSALPARARRIPSIWFQATIPEPHWMDRLATLLPARAVLAPSTHAARAQATIAPHRPVHVLHPGIDLVQHSAGPTSPIRGRLGLEAGTPLVGLVGRLQPWKGQREFLRAAKLVLRDHPRAHFAVVGGAILGREGAYPQELEQLARDLGIAERVTFTGHTREVPGWMRALDVVVNASSPEPFGLVIIEAMAAGRPVVAVGGGGGPADIIEHGRTGILCPDRTPEMLAEGIGALLADPQLRQAIGARGRAVVEERFSVQHMARAFGVIVREVLTPSSPST